MVTTEEVVTLSPPQAWGLLDLPQSGMETFPHLYWGYYLRWDLKGGGMAPLSVS